MEFSTKTGHIDKLRSACLVVGVHEGGKLSPSAQTLDAQSGGAIKALLRSGDIKGKPGQSLMLHRPAGLKCERLLLLGCGKIGELKERGFRQVAGTAATTIKGSAAANALLTLLEVEVTERDTYWKARQLVEAFAGAYYLFEQTKSKKSEDKPALTKVDLLCDKTEQAVVGSALAHAHALTAGMALTRDLANLPGNICTPSYLADQAKELSKQYKSVKTTVLHEKEMEELGMGALLSVAKGSRQPPRLIVMHYKGIKGKKRKPVVLVGKGLTFDAGGISIKPSAAMDEMKYDMCGGASVFGVIKALAELNAPVNVVGVVPSSENLPDGAANKPGDIVTSMSGQTIEILNTDAEGRLILCDALTYSKRFDPEVVIDIATLTGACIIALGGQASGLLGNDDTLVDGLLAAGQESGDRAWRLPLWEEYDEQLKSPFADMANIGGREAGTITAACFLSRYTKDYRWAHLDIAGTAWKSGGDKGATGRPVPMLLQYLLDKVENGA